VLRLPLGRDAQKMFGKSASHLVAAKSLSRESACKAAFESRSRNLSWRFVAMEALALSRGHRGTKAEFQHRLKSLFS
jgi:hypothetical protein